MSTYEEDMVIAIMRRMAWERARSELHSALATFYNDPRFAPAYKAITRFEEEVEVNGWMDAVVLYNGDGRSND